MHLAIIISDAGPTLSQFTTNKDKLGNYDLMYFHTTTGKSPEYFGQLWNFNVVT